MVTPQVNPPPVSEATRGAERRRLPGPRRWIGAALATGRRLPRAAWACFLITLVNAAVWGVLVPPFQVPDEISHFGYAQYLAETGKPPPQGNTAQYSPQEQTALNALGFFSVVGQPHMRGILTRDDDRALRQALAARPSPRGPGGASSATNQPPLYYAIAAVPYLLSPSQDILARLALMRLLSALLAAMTVLLVFLFLRELFPHRRWMWTVGALCLAFQPTFMFDAAGVQGDNLLFLMAAAAFLLLLRAFRLGLTVRRSLLIGLVTAAGFLTKLTFIALVPGIAVGFLLILWRGRAVGARRTMGLALVGAVAAALPVLAYGILNTTLWHRGGVTAGGLAGATAGHLANGSAVTLRETLDYIWELYLPRLPFMHRAFFTGYPVSSIWIPGVIGHFGWLDYGFPQWVYDVGKVIFPLLGALAIAGGIRERERLRRLALPLGAFTLMALGLLASIGYAGVRYKLSTGYIFEQGRYLFPLAPLYALLIAMAAGGLPRRWAPVLGGLLVVLAMAHGLFAETLTLSRYYG